MNTTPEPAPDPASPALDPAQVQQVMQGLRSFLRTGGGHSYTLVAIHCSHTITDPMGFKVSTAYSRFNGPVEALQRENKALRDKLKEARATLEAAHAALSTGSIEDAVPAKLLIEYTMINTVYDPT